MPQGVIRQPDSQIRAEVMLPDHADHQLQALHLAEHCLVLRQEHQGAQAVEHILYILGLLAVAGVLLSVAGDASQQLVHAFMPNHGVPACRRVLEDDAKELRSVDPVVVHGLRAHAFDEPRQHLRDLCELVASVARADVGQVLHHGQAIRDGLSIFLAAGLVDAQQDINRHGTELRFEQRVDECLRLCDLANDIGVGQLAQHFEDVHRDVGVRMVHQADQLWQGFQLDQCAVQVRMRGERREPLHLFVQVHLAFEKLVGLVRVLNPHRLIRLDLPLELQDHPLQRGLVQDLDVHIVRLI
mmetsp:Transcript_36740/g.104564  ORF Transcript_36740/g.104564 Transcript_36740/m.104564 type:complete len:299 (+) Transcript_36740:885-1781(+)